MSQRIQEFYYKINTNKHELALRIYVFIVLAHWAEHLVQAFQIFVLHWPRPESNGVLGYFFPWLVTSESLHYIYALVMLIGLFALRKGFVGRGLLWWNISLWIQFWHHIEHFILQTQVIVGKNIFGSPIPVSILQLYFPRVELHMFYNTVVFVPMAIAMYFHLFPTHEERTHAKCFCAVNAH